MARPNASIRAALLASSMMAWPAMAADVTPERLLNPDKEPQNWLMNHRTYDAQRYSPLDKINRGNVGSLRLAYAVAIGGTSANENLEATPLAEDGFTVTRDEHHTRIKGQFKEDIQLFPSYTYPWPFQFDVDTVNPMQLLPPKR